MKPVYTYKGRPITSYGKSPSPEGGFFRKLLFLMLALGVLLVIGGIWELTKYISTLMKPDPYAIEETPPPAEDQEAMVLTLSQDSKPSNKDTAAQNNSLRSRYTVILRLVQNRSYLKAQDEARKLLPEVDEKSPIYLQTAALLGQSGMELFYGNAESPQLEIYSIQRGDTLSKIANEKKVTVEALEKANNLNAKTSVLQINQKLKIYKGVWSVAIDSARKQLYLYDNGRLFKIYPVDVGEKAKSQEGTFVIWRKEKDPPWRYNGVTYPGGSAENILGTRKMELRREGSENPNLEIHGSNITGSTGYSTAFPGYFRLNNKDVEELFMIVTPGTPVKVVDTKKN